MESSIKVVVTNTGELQDIAPPFGAHLSASYIKSFAYITMKDRLPLILNGIINNMNDNKELIIDKYGIDATGELKYVIDNIIQLKDELMMNKPLELLDLINNKKDGSATKWNECIMSYENSLNTSPTWYNTVWFFSESYMYRRISQILSTTKTLTNYDPFEYQKNESFIGFQGVINLLAKYVLNLLNNTDNCPVDICKNELINLLKLNLWGNRCDLSLSNGVTIEASMSNPIDDLKIFESDLLIDNSECLWDVLVQAKKINGNNVIVDVILDNAGYELFTDLCLALFLTEYNIVERIRFYVKSIPWFVSDTMKKDFYWTIDTMKNSLNSEVQSLGHKCWNYIESGRWTIEVESFWTEPFDFSEMRDKAPKLYSKLAEASLVIFKGDLNYRKLLGDINWDYETNLMTALRGFKPTNVVSLRTIKADLVVGLSHKKAAELFQKQENWMITGKYGLIHFPVY